ncbi:MAG: hypothetical protein J6Y17_03440 [Elusimicrobiaceae bacterium]|nr:hypothetical protein [Elusimicrobiaceae bacterium]
MNKKVFILGVAALLAANAYAQRPLKMAKYMAQTVQGGLGGALSKNVPVTVLNAEMLGNQILRAQVVASSKMYVSSAQLFTQVQQNNGLKNLEPANVKLLGTKFSNLDEIVRLKKSAFTGYRGALLSERPAVDEELMQNEQVSGMLNVLDVQRYMQSNNNEFPQLFTVNNNGWLLATDIWTSREGTEAFRQVLDILIQEQAGQVNSAIVSQLAALYANASNKVPVQTVVEQLENWRAAHGAPTQAPLLPTDLGIASSLRGSNAENLWLSMQIRLLQLIPGIELPQVLKEAKVTQ